MICNRLGIGPEDYMLPPIPPKFIPSDQPIIDQRIETAMILATISAGASTYFDYDHVIYNDPATIVFWKDKTKTVVKCGKGKMFDPEKGLALCFMKRALGDKYHKVLKKENNFQELNQKNR